MSSTARSITFLLPGPGQVPVGGFKVAYEYAQGLASRGHRVHVVHAADIEPAAGAAERMKALAGYHRRRITGWKPDRWFRFRAPVLLHWVPRFDTERMPRTDAYVATAWQTAAWLGADPGIPAHARRLYLIQHDETWSGSPEDVRRTWTLPLEKIVIASWLADIARDLGESCVVIPNGLDFEAFGLDFPIAARRPASVIMLWHEQPWKGSRAALEVLRRVASQNGDLRATLFGVGPMPANLPPFARYVRDPSQRTLRALYNNHAILLSASRSEGWGLVGTEAMMCGAAFVATDVGGHRAYASHGGTALLSPPDDLDSLESNLLLAIGDPPLRMRLAQNAHAFVQQFTWHRAVDEMERVLGWDKP